MSEAQSNFIKEQLSILKRETEDALDKISWIVNATNKFNFNQADGEEIRTLTLYACSTILLEFRDNLLKKLRGEE